MGRLNMLTVETSRNLSDMIISLILPCLLFSKVVTNLQSNDIKQIGIICLISVLMTLICGLGGLGCYLLGKPVYWMGGCLSVALLPNISDLPIAYLQTFSTGLVFTEDQGDKGVAYMCIFTAVQILFQFNLGLFKLIGYDIEVQKRDQNKLREAERDRERSPTHNDEEMSYSSQKERDNAVTQLVSTSQSTALQRTQSKMSNISLRRSKSQTVHDLITEYSLADKLSQNVYPTPGQTSELEVVDSTVERPLWKKLLIFTYDNWKRPISVALISSMAVSMIPWVKALFVKSDQVSIPNAPDGLPALSFILDFTSYVAGACVPLGLLILGSTLSRLEMSRISWRFIRTPLMLSILRLILLPIIGTAVIFGLSKYGWFDDDDVLRFVSTIVWGLPNATSLIYITASYTPLEGDWRQMDQLAATFIIQYPLLCVSLPILTTYVIKISLQF